MNWMKLARGLLFRFMAHGGCDSGDILTNGSMDCEQNGDSQLFYRGKSLYPLRLIAVNPSELEMGQICLSSNYLDERAVLFHRIW